MSDTQAAPVVLSLGQCGADNWRLSRAMKAMAGAEYVTAATGDEALNVLGRQQINLVLVNRIFDADGTEGVDFIAEARQRGVKVPLMLVSNYEDAQAQAVANGALPGFGKSELHDSTVEARVREALQIK